MLKVCNDLFSVLFCVPFMKWINCLQKNALAELLRWLAAGIELMDRVNERKLKCHHDIFKEKKHEMRTYLHQWIDCFKVWRIGSTFDIRRKITWFILLSMPSLILAFLTPGMDRSNLFNHLLTNCDSLFDLLVQVADILNIKKKNLF